MYIATVRIDYLNTHTSFSSRLVMFSLCKIRNYFHDVNAHFSLCQKYSSTIWTEAQKDLWTWENIIHYSLLIFNYRWQGKSHDLKNVTVHSRWAHRWSACSAYWPLSYLCCSVWFYTFLLFPTTENCFLCKNKREF